jgi:hypothetical protein
MLAPVLGSLGRPYASRMQVICRHRFGAQLFHFILLRFRIGVESSETILLRRLILRLIKADQPVSFLATRTGPAPPHVAPAYWRGDYMFVPQPPCRNVLGPSGPKFSCKMGSFQPHAGEGAECNGYFLTSMHSLFQAFQLRSYSNTLFEVTAGVGPLWVQICHEEPVM